MDRTAAARKLDPTRRKERSEAQRSEISRETRGAEGKPEAMLEATASATTSMDEDEREADEAAKQRRSNGAVETQQRRSGESVSGINPSLNE